MKRWVTQYLRCPQCEGPLQLRAFDEDEYGIANGLLLCTAAGCSAWYPIFNGVPRMLNEALRRDLTSEFVRKFAVQLAECGIVAQQPAEEPGGDDNLRGLKLHTIRNFGFEWTTYSRFGWDDEVFNLEREEGVFLYKSLLSSGALNGKLVLDAGCGNGRYSYWASQFGARVIGIDLGAGVESAHANTRHLDSVQIVQADIFRLPFVRESFDRIFSIGVLMHTGDARKATESLATRLKPGGSLTVHLYGKGNAVYEYVDRTLRRRTVRLSIEELNNFTRRAWRVTRFLARIHLLPLVGCFIRLDPHPHCIFDWYSAPIATHHTYPEVEAWFATIGMRVVQTNKPKGWKSRIRSAIAADTVTVRAERQA